MKDPNNCWFAINKIDNNNALLGSRTIRPIIIGGIVASSAPRTGMKSSKKQRVPKRNQPGMSKTSGERRMATMAAWPALQVAFEMT